MHAFIRPSTVVLLSVIGLLAAACGSSADPTASPVAPATSAPALSEAPAPTDESSDELTNEPTEAPADEPAEAPSTSGDDTAAVTIGDTTYEFDASVNIIGRCDPDFFGAFWVSGAGTTDASAVLNMLLIPEDAVNHQETSTITVNLKDSEGRNWRADEDGGESAEAGESRVTSFEIDGKTVTGTASFVDTYTPERPTAEGTFTASCSE